MKKRILAALTVLLVPAQAFAQSWTPLITSSVFEGPRTDMLTAVGGIVTLLLIIVGIGYLSRIFR